MYRSLQGRKPHIDLYAELLRYIQHGEMPRVAQNFARYPQVDLVWSVDAAAHAIHRFDLRDFDVVLHQVLLSDVLASDRVFWTDSLVWVQAEGVEFDAGEPLPIVTFGADCFYLPIIERTLRASGRDHYVAVSCASSHGVWQAVRAGLGVAVVAAREQLADARCRCSAEGYALLPEVAQVVRVQPDARPVAVEIAGSIASLASR